jgi:hypothetical protein
MGVAGERHADDLADYARACLEAALSGLIGDESDVEVLGNADLGVVALHAHYGSTAPIMLDPADLLEHRSQPEPKCVCPPDLVARGGYRSTCEASHLA